MILELPSGPTGVSPEPDPIGAPVPRRGPNGRDRAILAALLLLVASGLSLWVHRTNAAMPFVLDEVVYLWQAELLARGSLTSAASPHAEFLDVAFIPSREGRRFGLYPLGYSLALVPWVLAKIPWGLNVFLAALSLFLLHRFAWAIGGARLAWTSVLLSAVSPFFIAQSTIYFSHALVLVLTQACLAAAMSWEAGRRRVASAAVAGASIGWAMNISPFACVPMAAVLLTRAAVSGGARAPSRREVAALLLPILAGGLLFLAVNHRLTGDALLTGYEYAIPHARPGFGEDVGPHGHSLRGAIDLTWKRLRALNKMLFGWPYTSLLFMGPYVLFRAFGALSRAGAGSPRALEARRGRGDPGWDLTLVVLVAATLFVYGFWFFHGNGPTWGPRYLYGTMPAFILLSAKGLLGLVDGMIRIVGNTRMGRVAAVGFASSLLLALVVYGTVPTLQRIASNPVPRLRREIVRFVRALDAEGIDRGTIFIELDGSWSFHSAPAFLFASGVDDARPLIFARSLGENKNRELVAARAQFPVYYAWLEPDSLRWHLAREPGGGWRREGPRPPAP